MEVKEYSLKISTEQAQKNVEDLNENLKIQEDLLFDLEKELRDYEKELKKTSKTDLAARKAINDQIDKTKTRLNDERFGLKELNRERKEANEVLKESEENAADYGGVLGMVDQKTGGLISSIGGMTKSVSGATKGFNLMKIAIIGTGIGALLIALLALGQAFKSSEKGQNAWNKIMGVLGAVVDVFTDRLADLGELLIDLFTSPVETLKNFGKAIKEFVMDKVEKVVEGLGFMGEAISKLFSGDFSGALESGKQGLKSLNDGLNVAKMATDAVTQSTKGLIKEIAKEAKIAAKIADQRARADKLDRAIVVGRAEADRDRAVLLEQAVNKEKFSLTERIQFLVEAARLEDEITKKEIEAARIRLQVKIAENKLGKSGKEALEEEAQLKASLIQIETARARKAKEVTSQIIGLRNEERANNKAKSDAARSRGQARRDERIANEKAVQDFKKSLRIEDTKNQFAKIEEEKAQRILDLKDLVASETEKEQILKDIQASFDAQKKVIEDQNQKAIQNFQDKLIVKDKENKFAQLEQEKAANLLALEELKLSETAKQQMILDVENSFKDKKKIIEDAEAEKEQEEKETLLETILGEEEETLAEQEAADLAELVRLSASKDEQLAVIKKYDELEAKQDKIKRDAEIAMAGQTFGAIAGLLGESSKAGKAAAAAAALINTYQGITAELATKTATPFGIALKIANVATIASIGFKSVKDIMRTNPKTAGAGGGSTPSASASTGTESIPPAASIPPAFNVVGASNTNQLADAIGGQSQQPIQTYVVANDVTSAQSLERNIVSGATID